VTSGAGTGTSGRRSLPPWLAAYAILFVATAVFNSVNVLSYLDERSWQNRPIEWWQPTVWEASSGIVLLALAFVPMLAIRRFPLHGQSWPRNLAIHAAVTVPFSLVHVLLMVALRQAVYAAMGESYEFGAGWDTFLYEYRKDAVTYALFTGTFWLTGRLLGADPAAAPPAPERETVVIDEGQRKLLVPPRDLLCARSSGNYVEFQLADGRRPLMRTTLAAMEAQLAAAGFVRTHRSWLVNPDHVVEIEAEGSGDYGLTLDDGTKVPVSRRYPQAIEALRR
jgi:hypothetical protein